MKLSEKQSRVLAICLTYTVPVLLTVPNLLLGIMGHMPVLHILANLLLPFGLALLFMTMRGRIGLNSLLLIPFMLMAGFQIVLLFLYADGSIIGVDMLVNVVTSNPGEASELLRNLKTAIAIVCVLYIPVIIFGTVAICYKSRLSDKIKRITRAIGLYVCVAGLVVVGICKFTYGDYRINEKLYPYNVMFNMGIAVERTVDSSHYRNTSADYTYNAYTTRHDSIREIYVAMIGETSRADNWELFGYPRPTNPRLSAYVGHGLVAFPNVLSESNTTHKSVPLMMSPLTAETYNDRINTTRSVILAFKEAGFATTYLTMQGHNGSYIDFFGEEADRVDFLREPDPGQEFTGKYDYDLIAALDSVIARGPAKQFIVLHMYGSHFNYHDRYPAEEAYFRPEKVTDAKASNRAQLINAYDNTIRHTDKTIAAVIERLDSIDCLGGMIYASDHGEDIFDDARKRFLHSSPTPTFTQLHVPMLIYVNERLDKAYPSLLENAAANAHKAVSSSASYAPTLTEMAGLHSDKIDTLLSVTAAGLSPVMNRLFLSDRNRAVDLRQAGFLSFDFELLRALDEKYPQSENR